MEGFRTEKKERIAMRTEIEQKLEALAQERAVSVDMQISPQEWESIERISIERDLDQFDFYGSDANELKKRLEEYFGEMGENTSEDLSNISNIITRVSEAVREGFKSESTWAMVRVSLPNDNFEIPRWHPDGKYYPSEGKQYKLVATIKGAQTRFGEALDKEEISKLQKQVTENYRRQASAEALKQEDIRIREELSRVVKEKDIAEEGRAVIYLVGEEDAVLHSEPHITEPRIFFAVLPGSREEIAEWESRSR